MQRFWSWVVMILCGALIGFGFCFIEFLLSLFKDKYGDFNFSFMTIALVLLLMAGCILLIYFGSKMTYRSSEKVFPSKKGTRYNVFGGLCIALLALFFVLFIYLLFDRSSYSYLMGYNEVYLEMYKESIFIYLPVGLYGGCLIFWERHYHKKVLN